MNEEELDEALRSLAEFGSDLQQTLQAIVEPQNYSEAAFHLTKLNTITLSDVLHETWQVVALLAESEIAVCEDQFKLARQLLHGETVPVTTAVEVCLQSPPSCPP